MNDAEYNEMRAASWRRTLSPSEEIRVQTYLAAHPQAQADWEEDLALTRQLQELPQPPLSSNFTAMVLRAIDAETTQVERSSPRLAWWERWLGGVAARVALTALVAVLGLAAFLQHEGEIRTRKQVAEDVEQFFTVANLGAAADPEVFEDFDAIQKLQPVSLSSDDDLLAALR